MKAEIIKNYEGQNVKISYWGNWEELVNRGDYSEWVETAGFVTIEGKVFIHEGNAMILQETGEINQFLDGNTKIKLEVL
ncbi:hypothetical protein X915_gp008 [Bacillus phage vB_BanS-Tsamsa]|uniref:Uncharacterized protein n=1 Tax=Bacillus phage vB_BanS-Tsamsa TaxID=1308863 RepID=U5J9R9_9CAUD|nr:hypothetical protein X915_gp008 [Bacillus phage vB_BanS-Tsamsa]AGI11911.1 hypothetical protein [Bacillus phage vB_BanS-Tsamsa]